LLPVEVTASVMQGVISVPHGWSHASANDLTDEQFLDPLSGNAALNGVPVMVSKHQAKGGRQDQALAD
jgi:hypothetical protein